MPIRPCSALLLPLAVVLVCLLPACANNPHAPAAPSDLRWALSGAGLIQPDLKSLPAPDDLLMLDDNMKQFARQVTHGATNDYAKITALAHALGSSDGLALVYRANLTLTPQQAFYRHSVNCLSYTMLFVALAREVGVTAEFNQVEVPPIWDVADDGRYILYMHVNARIGDSSQTYKIIDVNGETFDPTFKQRRLSDSEAIAQFYNNRAFELRAQGHAPEALNYLLAALALEPDRAYLWSNLAEMYLSMGQPRAAEIAVRRAMDLDDRYLPIYGAATHVYDILGDVSTAQHYRARAEFFQNRNPYYHYDQAIAALQRDDARQALMEARRAITLYPNEHRFFFVLGIALNDLGEPEKAKESILLALDMSDDPVHRRLYQNKLSRLRG